MKYCSRTPRFLGAKTICIFGGRGPLERTSREQAGGTDDGENDDEAEEHVVWSGLF
jgi:hypothetical protein